ncbi:hypothetical protein O181_040225 [Austropuccinia psidii MF-1]|uniref:Uncharacterized protein n=1 Tax=Austropuccinia psidii MF-1 TaxID=1389203 RepID=A0A9Q3DGB8_9BASI|nr:hypothetical protein [Austropuccinia psidii MF-1]
MNVHLQNNFTDNLVSFKIQNQQSYVLVKSKSFQKLIHPLNKDINLIYETKISKRIKERFLNDKEHIFIFINSKASWFSFSTDIWSGPGGMLYITLTAHYISSDWKPFTATIGFSKFTEAHTGKNIYTKIVDMLNDFFIEHSQKPRGSKRDAIQIDTSSDSSSETESDLSNSSNDLYSLDISSIGNQIMAIKLDNASSNTTFMDLAVKINFLKGFDSQIQCFAHILNLAAKDSLKELDGSIDKYQKQKTISQEIEKADIHHDIRLDVILEEDWTFFQQISEFLKVFATATDEVQGDSYPSLGLVMPWYQLLLETCQKTKNEVSRESQLYDAADQAYSKLESYYNIRSNSCAMCLILDPRFKLTWFTQHDLLQEDERNSDTNPIRYKDEALKHLKYSFRLVYPKLYFVNPASTTDERLYW